ncbi:MAG: hypothetical protein R2735_14170 [Microthrixaceae bacterium]
MVSQSADSVDSVIGGSVDSDSDSVDSVIGGVGGLGLGVGGFGDRRTQ